MDNETIVAVFDSAEHASAAVRDLEQAGIPSGDITQHAGSSTGGALGAGSAAKSHLSTTQAGTAGQPTEERGFWSSLFGAEPEYGHDTAVYDRSMQSGSTVVTVRGSSTNLDRVLDILERHNPIDIDERAATYGVAGTGPSTTLGRTDATLGRADLGTARNTDASSQPGTLSLSEETLAVGKRAINRGTTRVRRYVVETPVEETVNLRDERVTIERRPVTDSRAVSGADFSDKTIEVTETAEEAVVSKTAHVREEVVIRKDATDRSETVRDTVRREDVEITKDGANTTGNATTGNTATGRDTLGTTGGAGLSGANTTTTNKPRI